MLITDSFTGYGDYAKYGEYNSVKKTRDDELELVHIEELDLPCDYCGKVHCVEYWDMNPNLKRDGCYICEPCMEEQHLDDEEENIVAY